MGLRHELKHEISMSDMLVLKQRLRAVAKTDANSVDGKYQIRSLYFDNLYDKALREKIDGVNRREKFRIRYYNGDTSLIRLEKKSKINGLSRKEGEILTKDEVMWILQGDTRGMMDSGRPLVEELYCKMQSQGIRPKTIVDYTREAFTYPAGNVRITLDYNIRTGMAGLDFLNSECVTLPIRDDVIILEVKWDNFLPEIIRDAIYLEGRRAAAFSKYASCRVYG